MNPPILGVIPARLASTRLPRKPLHILAGSPLIEWVWRRANETRLFGAVVIATDSDEIAEAARRFGAAVELTSTEHESGTDRIAEIAEKASYRDYPIVANIQGDEPFIATAQLAPAVALVSEEGWEIGTAATPIADLDELRDSAVVKVVLDEQGGAMLFSRSPIPFLRDREPGEADFARGIFLRHIGVYVYQAEALRRWVNLPRGALEELERLEQLRPLAARLRIGVAVVPPAERGVDTFADAIRAESRLRAELLEVR